MKKGKKAEGELFGLLIFFAIVGIVCTVWFLGSFAYKSIYVPATDFGKQLNQVCINHGYNKSTDFKAEYRSKIINIECDKYEIVRSITEEYCTKKDKWGDCKSRATRIEDEYGWS